jgi:hypothetical protein
MNATQSPIAHAAADIASIAPQILQDIPQWITWIAGEMQSNGKFTKYPKGRNGIGNGWQLSDQWQTFQEALAAARRQGHSGIGFVLPAKTSDGRWIVALDFDGVDLEGVNPRLLELKSLWCDLGSPYTEASPSGAGLRMFVLSKDKVEQVSVPNPLGGKDEVFCGSPRWVTVTGNHLMGAGCPDASTSPFLQERPKPRQAAKPTPVRQRTSKPTSAIRAHALEQTPRNEAWVVELLTKISADCSYEQYRAVIWALESIGWGGIEELQRRWSMSAPHRFDERTLQTLRHDYRLSDQSVGFGTLVFIAKTAEVHV